MHSLHSGATMNSIMLDVKVDRQDPTDLYEQVAGEIRRAIAEGEAKPGERLPRRRTSRPFSTSTPIRFCGRYGYSATRDCSSSAEAAASPSPVRPSAAQ